MSLSIDPCGCYFPFLFAWMAVKGIKENKKLKFKSIWKENKPLLNVYSSEKRKRLDPSKGNKVFLID